MMVAVELGDELGDEVEEYQLLGLILWMKHSMSTFRCMRTVCSAQHTFFFLVIIVVIQLDLNLLLTELAEEEVMLVNHQLQILNRILQSGDEVEVSVVEDEVGDILKGNLGIDILTLGLELLQTFVVVLEGLKGYDQMRL